MTAKVEGVLKFNDSVRDEMLKRNIGKYSQWKHDLAPAIGEYYNIDYERQSKDLKDGKDLLTYTHDGKTEYSEEINRKDFQFGEKEEYSVRPMTYGELNPWISFQKGTYIQYIDDVFGKDDVMRHVDYVNNLLSGQYIENALRQTEVGVIEDINVAVAMQGVITTNPNNMKGEDTILGKISNRMYAQSLYNGAIFNSDRMKAKIRDGENYYDKAYLTPYLVNKYGNNLATVMSLSDIMKIGINETGIREDLGEDVRILDGYDGNVANLNLPEFRILNQQINNAIKLRGVDSETLTRDNGNDILPIRIYTPVNNEGYVNVYRENNAWRYDTLDFTDVDIFNAKPNKNSGRKSGPYIVSVYDEGEHLTRNKEFQRDENGISLSRNFNSGVFSMINENYREKDEFNTYTNVSDTGSTLLSKTSRLFTENKIDTMIARFHTEVDGNPEFTDTARSYFGNSHGRNLLKLDAATTINDTNGYENPYCRTWTYHHQYNQVKKMIRPFSDEVDAEVQSGLTGYRSFRDSDGISGSDRLAAHGVLQKNGFVRITPHTDDGGKRIDNIKNCMFSIENLAWKDVLPFDDNLSEEQRGPNGGRIMWFPPYDLEFNESVNVAWNDNTFIGRGEKVYTYTNTDRTGTLSFALLIDHPSIINTAAKGSYEALGTEQDAEADILRFFAGCSPLSNKEKEEKESAKQEEAQGENEYIKNEDSFSFKIYFPNNFSGLIAPKPDKICYDDFTDFVQGTYNRELEKDYWWQYLLVGNNTNVPTDSNLFRGYEMQQGQGLYDSANTGSTVYPIYACKDNKYNVNVCPNNGQIYTCTKGVDESKQYFYHIDDDLHQVLKSADSYKDTNSFQLNSKLGDNANEKEYTFAEVMAALLVINQGKAQFDTLYTQIYNYLTGNIVGVKTDRVQKLVNILQDSTITIENIEYHGNADNNDKENSKMLAERRAYAGSQMLKKMLTGILPKDENPDLFKKGVSDTGGSENVPSGEASQKNARFAEFTIHYSIKTQKQSELDNDKQEQPSGGTSEVTFPQYLTKIRQVSPVIDKYYMYTNSASNGDFNNKILTRFNSLTGVTTQSLSDDTFLREEVSYIIGKYVNKGALTLGYAISDGDTNTNFRRLYDSIYNALKKNDAVTPLLNPSSHADDTNYLAYMITYFVSINANVNSYISSDGFEYTLPLADYSADGNTNETYHLDITKLVSHLLLVHYIEDNMNAGNFDIDADYPGDYLSILMGLTNGEYNNLIFAFVNDLIDNRFTYTTQQIQDDYNSLDDVFADTIINVLNDKIDDIINAEDADNAQQNSEKIQEKLPEKVENKASEEEPTVVTGTDEKRNNTRYETEAEYFKNIETEDPLIWKSIQKKFQYFNPAFHSISPEGFNARLTFLQQCTRQGQTSEVRQKKSGSGYTGTATNLAFGRMPVCVIRIGDFINTRAIINTMSISYAAQNGVTWDLNPEGAGVQPMYAKVSLAITLLGGQSLDAPISRLQNAISFNYYANTEVYDNRADIASYKKNDKGEPSVVYDRVWTPLEAKDNVASNATSKPKAQVADVKSKQPIPGSQKELSDEETAERFNKNTEQ